MQVLEWVAFAGAVIVAWELVRFLGLRWLRRRLRDSTKAFVRRHEIRLDRFKLTRRSFLKTELLADPVIAAAASEEAARRGVPLAVVHEDVEGWLDEIIPGFSILSYFQVGLAVTRFVVGLVYDVVLDPAEMERTRRALPEDAVVIYLMNHRSNFDYLLVSLVLSRSIALSYAVGEWARVWPLEHLFRSFGSYFVRRGEKAPLYHVVLRRYVQVVSRYGITQGIFPEGGLTRDGRFRTPKTGLLTYIAELCVDPGFTKEILLVPVAINYDTVLEDRVLVREARGDARAPSALEKARSAAVFLVRAPLILGSNLARVLTGRVRRHGYAAARFAAPVSLKGWLAGRGIDLGALDPGARRTAIAGLSQEVLDRVAGVMPVPPVPLIALALLRVSHGPGGLEGLPRVGGAQGPAPSFEVERRALVAETVEVQEALRRRGARLVIGDELLKVAGERHQVEAERAERPAGLLDLEEAIVAGAQAEETVDLALGHLARRGLARVRGDTVAFTADDADVLAYYAHSVGHLLGEGGA